MDHQLSSGTYRVIVSSHGGELKGFYNKKNETEYIWQTNPAIWNRYAPHLFPIVGRLAEDTYTFEGKTYTMGQHGFLRDTEMEIIRQSDADITFKLTETPETLTVYPFLFNITITYRLEDNRLNVAIRVVNIGEGDLYFSYGNHTGFAIPLAKDLNFEDYEIIFRPEKPRKRIPLDSVNGNLVDFNNALVDHSTSIPLSHSLFSEDALIFKTDEPTRVTIRSNKDPRRIEVTYVDFPYLGIWSPYPARGNLICIEPWCGIADTNDADGDLKHKKGINILEPGEQFTREFAITVY